MRMALTTQYPTRISSTTYLKLARYLFGAQHVLQEKVHDTSERTWRTDTWHVQRLMTWAKSVRKHIKGHLETCHVGRDSICTHGNNVSAGVPFTITKEMAVGGCTKEVMCFVGMQGFLVSHAHGHVKLSASDQISKLVVLLSKVFSSLPECVIVCSCIFTTQGADVLGA